MNRGMTLLLAATAAWPTGARAAVHLDQLSDCANLRAIIDTLSRAPVDCVGPRTSIEQALARFTAGGPRLCFLRQAPSAKLSAFNCYMFEDAKQRTLTCVRAADPADIIDYQENFQSTYASRVTAYLEAAAKCPQGNQDAVIAEPVTLPWTVGFFAKFTFGFILPIGSRPVGDTAFYHAYGKADPSLFPGVDNPTIEYVHSWVSR